METYTEKLNDNQIQLLKKKYYNYISDEKIPYALFQIKLEDCTITVYTSKKAVYQGEKASLYLTQPLEEDEAGSDEVGTGDYFGPVTVCAVLVKKEDIAFLKELKVNDSKQINDDQIRQKAPLLIKRLTHSLLILDNIKYNQIHTINNMNQIKAKLHNQAYLHLQKKAGSLPERCIVDQFAPKDLYYRYLQNEPHIINGLTFETKAESKYLSVACASMIARYAFLCAWDKMEEHYQCTIPKGAGAEVDRFAAAFVNKYGHEELSKIAKMHFKNTAKLK